MQFALFLLLFVTHFAPVQSHFGQSIEGRLIFENARSECNLCPVDLLSSSGYLVERTYLNLSGMFVFRAVPPGVYVVRVDVDEYEGMSERIEVTRDGWIGGPVIILMNRKVVTAPKEDPPGMVISALEFLERYPRKAVEAFMKAMEDKKNGRNDRILKYLEEAVRIAPDFYLAHNELGIVYWRAARLDEAEREFLEAHRLNRSSADPLVYLSAVYIDEERPEEAVTTAEKAVKADSRSAFAFFGLGMALYKTARLDRAAAVMKKAFDLGARSGQVRLALAEIYSKLHNYEIAVEQLDSYLAENPDGNQRKAAEEMRQELLKAK